MTARVRMGVAFRLGCLVILIEGVVLFALGTYYLERFGAEVDRRLLESLGRPGALVAGGALTTDAFGQRDTLESLVGPALADAMVVTRDGTVLVALDAGRVGRNWSELPDLDLDWIDRAAAGAATVRHVNGGNSYLVHLAPVALMSGRAPVLFSYLRVRTTENEAELAALRRRLVGGSLVAMVLTTMALLAAVHVLVTRRLRRVAAAVERIRRGEYSARLGESRFHDEIGLLQSGFDAMSGRLREAFDEIRTALGDLKEADEKYRTVVENADEGMLVVQDFKCVFANPQMGRMLGLSPDELPGRSFMDFIHPDEGSQILERHRRRIGGEAAPSRDEFRIIGAGGEPRWVDINVVLIRWQERPATLNFLRDVTARREGERERARLQDQLAQAQKMESIGRLAGGVAHDFNNMLQIISGNAALILAELPADSPWAEAVRQIEQSAQQSTALTRQLLAFARQQAIKPETVDLNELIAGMLKMINRLIGENIVIAFHPGHGLWPVDMDPGQVNQIMANLCVNARDVITDTGRITVETRNACLDDTYAETHPECEPGDYVLLSVSDDGRGMDAETRAHIFEPFFTTKELGRGTGLGLATVFGIVKQNRGLISVYSEPGQGATFKIYLPRSARVPQATPAASVTLQRGTETVLLVEDQEPVLALGRRILERCGYTVLTAAGPQEAIELHRRHAGKIDLLVTDVIMPVMNGRDLCARLQEERPGLGCLFMSGYTADVILHHGIVDEGIEFIQKPFTIESLSEKVRRVLDRRAEG